MSVKRLMDGARRPAASARGKRATARCGHEGEHVIGQFVRCLRGCDDPPSARSKCDTEPMPLAIPPACSASEDLADIWSWYWGEDADV